MIHLIRPDSISDVSILAVYHLILAGCLRDTSRELSQLPFQNYSELFLRAIMIVTSDYLQFLPGRLEGIESLVQIFLCETGVHHGPDPRFVPRYHGEYDGKGEHAHVHASR